MWTVERDEDLTAPYAYKNTSWIAFEDETSVKIRSKYVILRDLAGLGVRDVENDNTDRSSGCGRTVTRSVRRAFSSMKRKPRDAVLSSLEEDLQSRDV